MAQMTSPPRSILITGCSSGIGLASARLLKARGWRVFATARAPDDIAALAAEGFEAFQLDYRDAVSIETTLDRVLRRTDGTLPPLLKKLLQEYSATGLPPAYLPKTPPPKDGGDAS